MRHFLLLGTSDAIRDQRVQEQLDQAPAARTCGRGKNFRLNSSSTDIHTLKKYNAELPLMQPMHKATRQGLITTVSPMGRDDT
jgi:hypothetical protein